MEGEKYTYIYTLQNLLQKVLYISVHILPVSPFKANASSANILKNVAK